MTRLTRLAGGEFGEVANFAERQASGLVEFERTVIDLGRAIHRIGALNMLISGRSMGLQIDEAMNITLLTDNFDLVGIHAARPRDASIEGVPSGQ